MAEPRAKRGRLSAEDVIGMLEDEYDGVESGDDNDDDYNEVMCEGSDDDFYDFDKDEVPPQDLDFYPRRDLNEETEETTPSESTSQAHRTATLPPRPDPTQTPCGSGSGSAQAQGKRAQNRGKGQKTSNRSQRSVQTEVDWKTEYTHVQVQPFTEQTGPTTAIPCMISEVFQLFFSMGIMQLIVDQTNLYANQVMGPEKFATWEQITVMELKAYFGFMILMGLNKLPGLVDYWKVDPIYHYSPIASRIPRDRFFELSRYLHFADNTQLLPPTDPAYDKLGKVRPIIDHLKARFQMLYKPTRNNAVDEAMIPFKGRSGIKQYMPKKPVKRGIKVWVRADSANGYFCNFEVYIGAGTSPEKGLGARVVKGLTQSLVGKNYHIFCDNFFSGIDLFMDLEKDGIYVCGTLRANRLHFPKDLKPIVKKGMKNRGDSETRQAENLVVTVWQDNRPVTILSTNSQATTPHTVQRRQKDGTRKDVTCPEAIVLYNKYMGGVDKGDQLRGYYNVRLKSRKMYKYIFWFLFDVAITNSFILHEFTPGTSKALTQKQFRAQLARELIGDYNGRKQPGRPRSLPIASTSNKRQHPQHFPRKAEKGRCRKCHSHYTTWYCAECGLRLCHTGTENDCFMKYHLDNQLYN